jgi:hypothetical protein
MAPIINDGRLPTWPTNWASDATGWDWTVASDNLYEGKEYVESQSLAHWARRLQRYITRKTPMRWTMPGNGARGAFMTKHWIEPQRVGRAVIAKRRQERRRAKGNIMRAEGVAAVPPSLPCDDDTQPEGGGEEDRHQNQIHRALSHHPGS